MEVIFKWVVLGLIVGGVAAGVRYLRQVNRERAAAIAEAERKRDERLATFTRSQRRDH
jgi:hypothetical protein